MSFSHNYKHYISVTLVFFTGVLIGGVFAYSHEHAERSQLTTSSTMEQRENVSRFKYINPLIECTVSGNGEGFTHMKLRQQDLEEKVNALKSDTVTSISVYVRDLNNGPWFGVDENIEYTPASLTKVPVMMAIYKRSESDPNFLTRTVHTPAELKETFYQKVQFQTIEPDHDYSIEELMRRSIVYSDNLATTLAEHELGEGDFVNVFQSINIPFEVKRSDLTLSTRDYAAFFRVLYNASFLTRENSEKALSLLSQSLFVNGIVAGVPEGVVVAHKFGERGTGAPDQPQTLQLHDCGIVYAPNNPYLLCVMTRGNDLLQQEEVIRRISRFVYESL